MLLAVAAEFRAVDYVKSLDELDDLALPLFGIADEPVRERMLMIAGELGGDGGFRPGPARPLDGLWLDRVLAERTGHPALIAAIYVEVGRRAGVELSLVSSDKGWFVAQRAGEGVVVIDPAGGGLAPVPDQTTRFRRHCAHEIAYAVLSGLAARYRASGDERAGRRAAGLRLLLPVDDDLRERIRAELA
jgi:regulator of sirC expression with transglutaminase-like and TPR domain